MLPAVAQFLFDVDPVMARSKERWTSVGKHVSFVHVNSWVMSIETPFTHNYKP